MPVQHTPHILLINEFYHPDICASAVVAADHAAKIAMLRPDWRISVITGNRAWHDPSQIYPDRDQIGGVNVIRIRRPAIRRNSLLSRGIGFIAFQRNTLRATADLGRIDLVIGTTAPPQGAHIAAKIARRADCPYVYKILDLYPDLAVTLRRLTANSFLHRRWLALDTRVMRQASAVVAISEPMMTRAAATRELSPENCHVIHDGDDPVRLAFTGLNRFREQYNSDGKFVVQFAGNMGLSHPFETILAAARSLSGDSTILFQFIGDGPRREALARDLPPNARLIDYQPAEKLGQVLDAADVCLISQHPEMYDQALPYRIYAILAAGRSSIFLGDTRSEIARWLTTERAGCVVVQGDVKGLINAVLDLKGDTVKRQSMGKAARQLIDAQFNSRLAAAAWVRLIEVLLVRRAS